MSPTALETANALAVNTAHHRSQAPRSPLRKPCVPVIATSPANTASTHPTDANPATSHANRPRTASRTVIRAIASTALTASASSREHP